MKKLILIIVLCISTGMLNAQKDLLITTKSDTIYCTVDQKTTDEITKLNFAVDSIKYIINNELLTLSISIKDVKIYHKKGDFYYYLFDGKKICSTTKLENYESLKPIQKIKNLSIKDNNSKVIYESGQYLKNACTYHFVGLAFMAGGATVMATAKEKTGQMLCGTIMCIIGFGFDIAAWNNIGKSGNSLRNFSNKDKLSLTTTDNGIGLVYKF